MIPEAPQRVVSLGYTDQDAILALGVVPVAIREFTGNRPVGHLAVGERPAAGAAAAGPHRRDQHGGDRGAAARPDRGGVGRAHAGAVRHVLADRPDDHAAAGLGPVPDRMAGRDAPRRHRARPGRRGRPARRRPGVPVRRRAGAVSAVRRAVRRRCRGELDGLRQLLRVDLRRQPWPVPHLARLHGAGAVRRARRRRLLRRHQRRAARPARPERPGGVARRSPAPPTRGSRSSPGRRRCAWPRRGAWWSSPRSRASHCRSAAC